MDDKPGYKHSEPFDSGFLAVDNIHNLYYEQYGKKDGKPVIFLHGGPGGGTTSDSASFFNPEIYHVVLLDQRGAGKSTPNAELTNNTTQLLVQDIETLRQHLHIEKWHLVFGGSWGSTLALAYAQTHPAVVGSLILRGIFLGTQEELDWTYLNGAMSNLFPEEHAAWLTYLPEPDRANPVAAYFKLLTSDDRTTRLAAAQAWNRLESGLSMLVPPPDAFAKHEDEEWGLAHSRLEAWYFVNQCFLTPGQLLDQCGRIAHIPTAIVQGRYDIVCIPKTAYLLHKALPKSDLYWVADAGHSANEPGTRKKLVELCDRYADLVV
ncbi:proline iminopeptidase [Acrodontium crateriforme]|uniref:Proline iminopeptidase n=1 Tax=Acrodontium crateriforme TaxID=150365 RepID=A0AAQ3MB64_9PEZI|nr:proline iminopeptidase [Acrodontium crateriforme]